LEQREKRKKIKMASNQIKITGLTASEEMLEQLMRETYDGVRDDLKETQENADMYLGLIGTDAGREAYGHAYMEALKIKALARTRQLTFLNMFKDRVGKKEALELATAGNKKEENLDITQLNNLIDEMKKGGKFENVPPVIRGDTPEMKPYPTPTPTEEIEEEEIYTGEEEEENNYE
jgi:hypothetical protein